MDINNWRGMQKWHLRTLTNISGGSIIVVLPKRLLDYDRHQLGRGRWQPGDKVEVARTYRGWLVIRLAEHYGKDYGDLDVEENRDVLGTETYTLPTGSKGGRGELPMIEDAVASITHDEEEEDELPSIEEILGSTGRSTTVGGHDIIPDKVDTRTYGERYREHLRSKKAGAGKAEPKKGTRKRITIGGKR